MADAARKHKVSEPTIYAWRKHFGEMMPSDVKRLKALELENNRLKRLLAERDLDISVLKGQLLGSKKKGHRSAPTYKSPWTSVSSSGDEPKLDQTMPNQATPRNLVPALPWRH